MKHLYNILILMGVILTMTANADPRIIEGEPVEQKQYKEVVSITVDSARCTATVIGPTTILTAAHCAKNDSVAEFKIGKQTIKAKMTRSPLYPVKDHDVALGKTDRLIPLVLPASIGNNGVELEEEILMLGYGCTQKGGGGGNDGILRRGYSKVNDFSNLDFISRGEAALCFGDSGGPAFRSKNRARREVVGVASKGNIDDTSYYSRLDLEETRDFLEMFVELNGVQICGINLIC